MKSRVPKAKPAKRIPVRTSGVTSAKRRAKPAKAAKPARPVAPPAPKAASLAGPDAMLQELRQIHSMMARSAAVPVSPDATLDGAVDSLRRLLSEFIEARLEQVLNELAAVRPTVQSNPAAALTRLDHLMESLGATAFQAPRGDFVDPLIHSVTAERHVPELPNGVVVETLAPGFRTSRGVILAKAAVAVNRRG